MVLSSGLLYETERQLAALAELQVGCAAAHG